MKNRESNSIDAQQDIAQFGKAARHPLCQAWLGQKRSQQRLLKLRKEAEELLEGLKHAQQIKKEAQGLLDKFYEERREDVIEALAVVQKVSAYPPKYQAAYETTVNLFDQWMAEAAPIFEGRFDRECDALAPGPAAKSEQALRALQTVKHRWNNPRPLKVGQRRELEIMKLVRQKASSAAAAKGGVMAGYAEAVFGGRRPLTDEHWSGRVTAQEIRAHLMAVGGAHLAGDPEAKEIRRVAQRLGIVLAEDQPGRKRKPPHLWKEQMKRPVGRPRNKMNPEVATGRAPAKKAKHDATPESCWRPSESDWQAFEQAKKEIRRLRRKLRGNQQ